MISVYFNTLTLDSNYQVTVFIFFFAGKKMVSSEVPLMHKALTRGYFPLNPKFLIESSEVSWVMSVWAKQEV